MMESMATYDLFELIQKNSGVDKRLLEEGRVLLRELRARSPGKGYRLASPATRKRVVVGDSSPQDPRTIQLTSFRSKRANSGQ